MGAFEFLLLFAAVVLGLAITDLAISLHRLLSAGARVRWDWLAPLAAIVALLKIITQWWSWYLFKAIAGGLTFEMFIVVVVSAILLFLMAASALPDEVGPGPFDLRAYYPAVSRRFWLLFAIHWLLITAVALWAQVVIGKAHLDLVSAAWLVIPVALFLAITKSRLWHTVGLVGFIGVYCAQFFGQSLTG